MAEARAALALAETRLGEGTIVSPLTGFVLRKNLEQFKGEFLAQNVFLTEEAKFNDAKAFDPAYGRVFKPSTIKEIVHASKRQPMMAVTS